jgi:hypothetical protein
MANWPGKLLVRYKPNRFIVNFRGYTRKNQYGHQHKKQTQLGHIIQVLNEV